MVELPPLAGDVGSELSRIFGSATLPATAHAGLVFERYPRLWTPDSLPVASEHARTFLKDFVNAYRGQAQLGQARLDRQLARLRAISAATRDYTTTFRFATGLGAQHPLENGFTFDDRVGVPWLAGSGVKGLARAAARVLADGELDRLLGPPLSEVPGAPHRVGEVVFLGAWPVRWPTLDVDIVNPHHPKYVQAQAKGDESTLAVLTEEPKPVYFLSVAANTKFRFFLTGQGGRPLPPESANRIWEWLDTGLAYLGAGAKTAAGYGVMVPAAP